MEKFIARQPIFDSHRVIFGYELLFRSSLENFFPGTQMDVTCASTTDNLFLFGTERLTQGRRAFINCTRDFLVRDYPALLPKDRVVLELLENIEVDNEVIAACRRFKQAGFVIALDDFRESPAWSPLLALADFIKVDLLATPRPEQFRLARKFAATGVHMLAEKVETYDDFRRTLGWGYSYFQGYFFSRPEILTRHDIPANKLTYLAVLQAANRPEFNLNEVAQHIKEEPSLSYRLLRYLNSPAFFLVTEIQSIAHALTMLGEHGTRKWVSLVAIACMGEGKPQELIVLPLVRARFCELLGEATRNRQSANNLFLLGLLSSIDAILDMKMEDVLKEISIHPEVRDALLGEPNSLRKIFDLALKYETGSWEGIDECAASLHISPSVLSDSFLDAVEWAKKILTGQPAEVPRVSALLDQEEAGGAERTG